MSRKEIMDKDLSAVLNKDIGNKNPIFSTQHITELHELFSLYADPRQRRADIRDMLMTAKTLGLDQKHQLVFRSLMEISESSGSTALDFEGFIRQLTQKIGNPFTEEARKANFTLLDLQGKGQLDINDMRYINEQLRYGFSDEQLEEIIHSIAGYGAQTIPFEKFSRYVEKKINKKKLM